jgi:acetyl esterase
VDVLDGHVGRVRVRTYAPEATAGTLVYAHGGGWVTGDLEYADQLCRHVADDLGLRVVSVDYRLAPEHPWPAGLEDLSEVWSAVRAQEGGWCALGGDSAGGHLAAGLAHGLRTDRAYLPDALLLVYPVLGPPGGTESYTTRATAFPTGAADMDWFWGHLVPGGPPPDAPTEMLPGLAPDLRGTPPTHLVVAGHDPLHDEGAIYAERLREAGVPVSVTDHPTLCHGFLRLTGACTAARAALGDLVRHVGRLHAHGRATGAVEQIHAYDSAPTGPAGPGTHAPRESR